MFEIRREDGEMLVERGEGKIAAGFEPETPVRFVRKAAAEDMLHFDAVFVAEFSGVAIEQSAEEFSLALRPSAFRQTHGPALVARVH